MAKKKELKKRELERKLEIKQSVEMNVELKNILFNLVLVVALVLVFYFITELLIDKSARLHYVEQNKIVEFKYDELLTTEIHKKTGTYYVLVYDFDSKLSNFYDNLGKLIDGKVYKVNNSDLFNKNDLNYKKPQIIKVMN